MDKQELRDRRLKAAQERVAAENRRVPAMSPSMPRSNEAGGK